MKSKLKKAFQNKKKRRSLITIITLLILMIGFGVFRLTTSDDVKYDKISLTEFTSFVLSEDVKDIKNIKIHENSRKIQYTYDNKNYEVKYPSGEFLTTNGNEVLKRLSLGEEAKGSIEVSKFSIFLSAFFRIIYFIFFGLLILVLLKTTGLTDSFDLEEIEDEKTTFDDIAGYEHVKYELQESIDLLTNPLEYEKYHTKMLKGLLLEGPQGNGKTLFAKAIAGESKTPFLSISGADFEEKFVGVGTIRVKTLFKRAEKLVKKHGKCIIFIDEIDAVGTDRTRKTVVETNQSLNKILTKMDGFNKDTGIFIIAATNLAKSLDPALTRAGRFDRIIKVNNPNLKDREAIINLYLNKRKEIVSPEVFKKDDNGKDYCYVLAQQTEGLCGADFNNLVNEASFIAKRLNKELIDIQCLRESFTKIVAGLKLEQPITEEERKISAYHEAGHATVQMITSEKGYKSVAYITINSYGESLGHVSSVSDNKYLYRKSHLENEIKVLFAGRAVEDKILYGDYTTGAGSDLQKASQLITKYTSTFGMSEEFENLFVENLDVHNPKIQKVLTKIRTKLYKDTMYIIENHYDIVEKIAFYLLENESIEQHELPQLLKGTSYEEIHKL